MNDTTCVATVLIIVTAVLLFAMAFVSGWIARGWHG